MSFFSFLFSSSPEQPEGSLSQTQSEALVDLLYLAIYADNHLSQTEEATVTQELESLKWEGEKSVSLYINDAITRARDARNNSGYQIDYLASIADRLGDPTTRSRVLATLESVLKSDGPDQREEAFLAQVRAAFRD